MFNLGTFCIIHCTHCKKISGGIFKGSFFCLVSTYIDLSLEVPPSNPSSISNKAQRQRRSRLKIKKKILKLYTQALLFATSFLIVLFLQIHLHPKTDLFSLPDSPPPSRSYNSIPSSSSQSASWAPKSNFGHSVCMYIPVPMLNLIGCTDRIRRPRRR